MSILISWLGPLRAICMAIDGIAFSLLDQAYNIVIELSSARILEHDAIKKIMFNLYILFGVVAFFRLAIVLVNSILDPEKLNEKGKGLGNIFFRVVGMLIILGVTPFLFEMSYDVQEKIVSSDKDKNVIFSLILGDDANIGGYDKDGYNAGKALQNVVLSSLITIDDRYLVNNGAVCTINENNQYVDSSGNDISDEEFKTKCGFVPLTCVPESDGKTCTMQGGYIYDGNVCNWKNCQNAVDKYNKMYVNEEMKPSSLAGSAGVSAKIDTEDGEKEEVYVYDYMFIVTSIAGVAMTWIILSFAIDIAVRMFELIVLEVLSPLFIATFVDPKSAQSGPFKNWLSAVGKSYASLYIKLAILALMTLLIMIVNQSEVFNKMRGEIAGFAKIFVIFGLLVFAKKAPKWIMDMIGIKGDGMGLWSPKKLRENMAGVGAMSAALGAGTALVGNKLANARRKHELKKSTDGYNKYGFLGKNKKNDLKRGYDAKDGKKYTGRKAVSMYKRDNNLTAGQSAVRSITGDANAIINGIKASKDAKGTISAIKAGIGASKDYNEKYTQMGPGIFGKAGEKVTGIKDNLLSSAYGSGTELHERRDKMDKDKTRKKYFGTDNFNEYGELLQGGMGDFVKSITDKHGHIADDKYDAYAMCYAKIKGGSAEYDVNGNLQLKDSNGNSINVSDAYKNISSMLTSSGAAHFDEMYNKKQNATLDEYNTNQRNINDAAQSVNTVNSNIENLLAGKDGISRNASTGALEITGVGGNAIKIDTRDMKDDLKGLETQNKNDLAQAESDYNNGLISASEYDAKKQRGTVVDNFIKDVRNDTYMSTQLNLLSQSENSLNSLMERQSVIESMIVSIGKEWKDSNGKDVDKFAVGATESNAFKTLGQKAEKISLDADKISKTIAGIDSKPGDNKKE